MLAANGFALAPKPARRPGIAKGSLLGLLVAALGGAASGCSEAGGDAASGGNDGSPRAPFRQAAQQPVRPPSVPSSAAVGSRQTERPRLELVRLTGVERAEDGRGRVVPARAPVAFDVDAALVTPGARVPELRIGELVLSSSYYPRPGVIRFVLADGDALRPGAPVTIGHAGEGFRRILVEPALQVLR